MVRPSPRSAFREALAVQLQSTTPSAPGELIQSPRRHATRLAQSRGLTGVSGTFSWSCCVSVRCVYVCVCVCARARCSLPAHLLLDWAAQRARRTSGQQVAGTTHFAQPTLVRAAQESWTATVPLRSTAVGLATHMAAAAHCSERSDGAVRRTRRRSAVAAEHPAGVLRTSL
jgi:hypothetical protein